MERSILRFENVTVAYGEVEVLRNFSCDIKAGEFVSVIGPNGSGKSTMVNAVLGGVSLKGGNIYIDDRDNRNYSSKERARFCAVVPQTFATSFGFTVKDIVMMGRNPYLGRMQSETAEDLRIVEDSLRMTNTLHLKDRKITSLSGGERQRVVIAGALAQSPRLLILDEPTNHLDIHHTLEIMQLVKELNQTEGLTVFAVLHDINMAARFSDRIVLMQHGECVKIGSVKEVINEPTLKPVYKVDMVVRDNRLTDSLEVVALRMNKEEIPHNGHRVHVVCGGGSGELILEELRSRGYELSCGVVNLGDSDDELCRFLQIPTITEIPYSSIGEAAKQRNLSVMEECEILILTDVPIGNGNLSNVESLCAQAKSGKRIYIIDSPNRDYTDSHRADKLLSEISALPNVFVLQKSELVNRIKTSLL